MKEYEAEDMMMRLRDVVHHSGTWLSASRYGHIRHIYMMDSGRLPLLEGGYNVHTRYSYLFSHESFYDRHEDLALCSAVLVFGETCEPSQIIV